MKPNVFKFATSELSQDAILCWLAAWGDPTLEINDPQLHKLGISFLELALKKHDKELPDIIKPIDIKKQYKHIDVLITINDNIAICIEDKVGSIEHSGQLARYLAILQEDGFTEDQIIPIYVQTGEQSNYQGVNTSSYSVIKRGELMSLFQSYLNTGGGDSIAKDYYEYLKNIDNQVNAFISQPVLVWDDYAWQGFYSELKRQINGGEWGHVNNPSGGFWGFWWHWSGDDECSPYLQLEENRLCFKIEVAHKDKQPDLKWKWSERILKESENAPCKIIKPRVMRKGNTMTVAVLESDYRQTNNDGIIDIEKTAALIRECEKILDKALSIKD